MMARKPAGGGADRRSRWPGILLWFAALLLMLGAAEFQERTGPTKILRGSFESGGQSYEYGLPRSENTDRDARIELPDPGDGTAGKLRFKRLGTDDPYCLIPLVADEGLLAAALPAQPPAGKLEYDILLRTPAGEELRIPPGTGESVIIRFKGKVPGAVLAAHIIFIFLALWIGLRTGLAALFRPRGMRELAWTSLVFMTVGGMILGPVVQRYAFGKYWTGFPFGYDLTDNKMLIMWLVWLAACAVIGFRPRGRDARDRVVLVIAVLVMMTVYLIPHSLRGSTLDYEKLDQGVPPSEAIGTG
jgi:hypothetical protein